MMARDITLETMDERHLDEAVRLSGEAGWPHRHDDWRLVLAASDGLVALDGEAVVGTVVTTRFDASTAAINMVIVDAAMRGRGIGRRLMEAALARAGDGGCRLTATQDGLPLYEKLGFVATGEIVQHQGERGSVAAPDGVEWAQEGDLSRIADLDAKAQGFRRDRVLAALGRVARYAVLREGGAVEAAAARRPFGRGTVIGPILARSPQEALRLLDFLLAQEAQGAFTRVDTDRSTGLGPHLAERGLVHVGGGIAMRRGPAASGPATPYRTFALINQALG
ncbi:GNAT family N-acetyltransferase [Aurantimonas sp. Leaf443]|uniref:GNAT family N-acetyltransferase n=1 Tax=Aurantimonas sp. Leaf443 TaxID=1736378 RepID=UPI0006F8DF60|nr:GNAT family N-acetyltransferase [Aurantimonas sp. Leaf443]KQT82772.1 GNAT family acetyltransferase [Aurantimonas sp. Leaf443]